MGKKDKKWRRDQTYFIKSRRDLPRNMKLTKTIFDKKINFAKPHRPGFENWPLTPNLWNVSNDDVIFEVIKVTEIKIMSTIATKSHRISTKRWNFHYSHTGQSGAAVSRGHADIGIFRDRGDRDTPPTMAMSAWPLETAENEGVEVATHLIFHRFHSESTYLLRVDFFILYVF